MLSQIFLSCALLLNTFALGAPVNASIEASLAPEGTLSSMDASKIPALEESFRALEALMFDPRAVITRNDVVNGLCGEIIIIYARGTFQLGNVGMGIGPSFIREVSKLRPGRVIVQGVIPYSADVFGYLQGGSPAGAGAMASIIERAVKQCPDAKLVVGGYSQGAQVAHLAAARVSADVFAHISSIVLFGDPLKGTNFPTPLMDRVTTFCRKHDLICAGWPIVLPSHAEYGLDCGQAAEYVASKL